MRYIIASGANAKFFHLNANEPKITTLGQNDPTTAKVKIFENLAKVFDGALLKCGRPSQSLFLNINSSLPHKGAHSKISPKF